MTYLRERAGYLIIGLIGFAIAAFVLTDAFQVSNPFLQDSRNSVGSVDGESISYQQYSRKVEENVQNMQQQMRGGAVTSETTAYAQEQAWMQLKQEILLNEQVKEIGIRVGPEELFDLVQGNNPDPQIRQMFTNPETKQFDPKAVVNFLKNMDDQMRPQWIAFEKSIQQNRAIQKYLTLIGNSIFATTLDIEQYNAANTQMSSAVVVSLPYSSVSDADLNISQTDLEKVYKENKIKFEQKQEQRIIEYVTINVIPSTLDTVNAVADINRIATEFKETNKDELFYVSNADTKAELNFYKKAQLNSPILQEHLFNASVGTVYGPYFENGAYKAAKLLAVSNTPDSVKARHILIGAQQGGLTLEGVKEADSIKQAIQSGKISFTAAAMQYSSDQGSASKGGDLGFFGHGMMVPEFEQAAFNSKVGELTVVQSQFGTHIIEVTAVKNVSKAVKIAVVDRIFEASQDTRNQYNALANQFVASATGTSGGFAEAAKNDKLRIYLSDQLNAIGQGSDLPGFDNSRDVIRWTFSADNGAVSEPFDMGNKYLIAHLVQVRKPGLLPLDMVKSEVEVIAKKQKRGEMLAAKAASVRGSIEEAASALNVQAVPFEQVSFGRPSLSGLGFEPALTGGICGIQLNQLSVPVIGENGVYIFVTKERTEPSAITNPSQTRLMLESMQKQSIFSMTFSALEGNVKIVDNRANFL